jgi:predicted glycosyltransferase
MKVLISISHPAWAHQFHNMINLLEKRGHKVKVLVVKKDRNWEILEEYGIPYTVVGNSTGKNKFEKAIILLVTTFRHFIEALKFKTDVLIGRPSPMMAITAFLIGKKNIPYCDTERSVESLFFSKLFSYKILTPMFYRKDLGKKHMRIETFKELFYLHPNYFKPNPKDLELVGLKEGEKFSFVRFVAWNASHDLGHRGFTNEQKMEIIKHLEKYGKVLLSSEEKLPKEFDKYIIKVPHTKLHSIMSFAQLFVGDGLTMGCECVVMGVHAIFTSELTSGSSDEMESEYELMYSITDRKTMLEDTKKKIGELLSQKNIREIGKKKLKNLLKDKKDVNEWWIDYLEGEIKNV